jgi:hypothetical protein
LKHPAANTIKPDGKPFAIDPKKGFDLRKGYGIPVDSAKVSKAKCVNVKADTLADCVNEPVPIDALLTGAVVKVPIVLAQLNLQINVDAIIDLPEPALEIKQVSKNLKITQCLLLQDTNMLFIKGFVRKNIDYSTKGCCFNKTGVCGDIRHCTVDVPVSCTTPVLFNGIEPLPPISGTSEEFAYFKEQKISGPDFSEKSKLLSSDITEFNQISTEYYNEMPYCELISSRIVEFNEYLNPTAPHSLVLPFEEKEFCSIEEKMVIFLTVKILQNRQLAVPPLSSGFECGKPV